MTKHFAKTIALSAFAIVAMGAGAKDSDKAADGGGYSLWLSEENGFSTLAVSEDKGGAFAVATGEGDLDVLSGDAAEAAFKALSAKTASNHTEIHIDDDADEKHEVRKKVVVKTKNEDSEASKTVRIVKMKDSDSDKETDIDFELDDVDIESDGESTDVRLEDGKIIIVTGDNETTVIDSGAEAIADIDGASKMVIKTRSDDDEEMNFTRISGVDAEDAADFIDDADGLERDEKAAMKAALNL